MHGKEVETSRVRVGQKNGDKVWAGCMDDSKHTSIMANNWSTTMEKGTKKKRRVGGSLVECWLAAVEVLFWACSSMV